MRFLFRLFSGLVTLVAVFAILVVVVAPYTFLPDLLERAVASTLQTRLGTPSPPEVTLESDPKWRMLAGNFSGGTVELGTPEVGGVRPDSVALDLDLFDVNVFDSISSGALRTEAPISGAVTARFSEGTLSEIAAANAGGYPVRGVALDGELLVVEAEADVFGVVVPVSVGGIPGVLGGDFVFRPEEVSAMGVRVPDEITQSLLAGTSFRYPLGELPYGILMDDARVEDGNLVVTGVVPDVTGGRTTP